MFIATWIMLMNYNNIRKFSSSDRICYGFISIAIATYVFVGVATLYHMEHLNDDYKELIKDVY